MKIFEELRRHPWKIAITLACVAAGAWYYHAHRENLSREAIIEFGRGLPAVWLIVLFLFLPLLGFPISVFLVLIGIRFGFAGGMAISTVVVFFHNLAAYWLTHGLFRDKVRRFMERAGYAIPPIRKEHRVWFTALFAAVHGPPYFAKIYLLALTDIPFRIYFWVGAPVYVFFCALPVAVGSAATTMHMSWIYWIVGAFAVVTLAGFWLRRREFSTVADQGNSENGEGDAEKGVDPQDRPLVGTPQGRPLQQDHPQRP